MPRIHTGPYTKALVVENPHETLDERLALVGIEALRLSEVPDEDSLIKAIQDYGAEVVFKRSRVPITRRVVESCPKLSAIQLCCIGDDSIDKEACADHGVMVYNDPVSNGRSVVEMAIGHMIALSRRFYETDVLMSEHKWEKTAVGRFEVRGKRLGILGLGNIGRQVARAAEAMGLEVCFFDARLVATEVGAEMGWDPVDSIEELFKSSDIVSVHTSARDPQGRDNAFLLDPFLGMLAKNRPMPSPRLFLNLARGNLHSADALLKAVEDGAVRRAAVDVYPEEPTPGAKAWENPYAGQMRITCTPHIGAATQEAQPRIARRVSQTMGAVSRFGSIRDCVFSPKAQLAVAGSAAGGAILAVVHSTARGTKKAVDDAIYEAEASNLGSTHLDFPNGVAYDLSVLDRPLKTEELQALVQRAKDLAGDPRAIRSIRQIELSR
ncbi:MAG: 3-phosphoglycerate dehydrogenase [Proteobacteria bacterium]|nr:3-phosphoglycerate dehydrogenase [Pseudomonadota bacterium]